MIDVQVSDFGSIQTKPGNKRTHAVGGQGSPRKRQRKNAKQKITQEISNGDDFSAFLEQLACLLKQAPPLGVHEPMPRPDPHLCSLTGVTVLADKPSKFSPFEIVLDKFLTFLAVLDKVSVDFCFLRSKFGFSSSPKYFS